jgi:cell division protein ZapD
MRTEDKNSENIIFELPLSDHTRICLRLEQLLEQLQYNMHIPAEMNSDLALTALLKMLDVIDRPDLKSRLTQALTQNVVLLSQLESSPNVDQQRLKDLLNKLDQLLSSLYQNRSRIGESLRSNEFLSQLRLQQGTPGGICSYKVPAYSLWIKKPSNERLRDLEIWVSEFQELFEIVKLLLKLTREGSSVQTLVAGQGFYQQNLDANTACHLISVSLSAKSGLYPEISAGKHRLTIRFLIPNFYDGRAVQAQHDVPFQLCCGKS